MSKSIEEYIQDLKSDDEFVVEEAVGQLEFNSQEAIDPLIEALKGNDKEIKKGACKVIRYIKDPKAIEPLIELLYDGNKMVRREASTTLSLMGEEAVDPLLAILNDDDWKVRGAAVWALGGIGDKRALESVEKLLDDEKNYVVVGAKYAVDNIKKQNAE